MSKYTLGADPEVFLRDVKTGNIVPAFDRVGGTKQVPRPIPQLNKGFKYQEDGAAYEFNIPPQPSAALFSRAIMMALEGSNLMLLSLGLQLDTQYLAEHRFSARELEHPFAQRIGCLEDNDAFKDGTPRQPWSALAFGSFRFCGGHVHYGYPQELNISPAIMAQLVYIFVHQPLMKWDPQNVRRNFYGSPGIFRAKPYGIEYRSMSNFWLKSVAHIDAVASLSFWLLKQLRDNTGELADYYSQLDLTDPMKLKAPSTHPIHGDWCYNVDRVVAQLPVN